MSNLSGTSSFPHIGPVENENLYTLISSSEHMTTLIVAQMLPGWRIALGKHQVFWKTVWANGRFKKLRALPRPIALQTIRSLKENALAELRQEATNLVHEFQMIDEILDGELERGDDDE